MEQPPIKMVIATHGEMEFFNIVKRFKVPHYVRISVFTPPYCTLAHISKPNNLYTDIEKEFTRPYNTVFGANRQTEISPSQKQETNLGTEMPDMTPQLYQHNVGAGIFSVLNRRPNKNIPILLQFTKNGNNIEHWIP